MVILFATSLVLGLTYAIATAKQPKKVKVKSK